MADERAELDQLRATTLALIQALVDQGLMSNDKAQGLVRQAGARSAAPATAAGSAPEWGRPLPAGTVRVPYISETVKAQIKEDVKLDVLATAREEGWADARVLPSWLKTFNFEGDLRVRGESTLLSDSNTPASVYRSQVESPAWSPDLTNTQTTRSRLTLRARFGFTATMSDDLAAGMRISTGTSPTSASATLGAPEGFFNGYSLLLDRAWMRWEPTSELYFWGGRMPSPFRLPESYRSSDLLWPDDLSLDGVAVTFQRNLGSGVYGFANAGAFVVQELQLTTDKWLLGGQFGVDWAVSDRTQLRLAASMYDFQNIEGVRETSPPPSGPDVGTVPYFSSVYPRGSRLHGNTLIRLNDPTDTGTPVWGLASQFKPVVLTAALRLSQFDPFEVGMTFDYVKNTGFDLADIQSRAGTTSVADLANKTTGMQLRFELGSKTLGQPGAWNTFLALRSFERDAWPDAFTDTTWNTGGTNYKGYSLGGSYAFDKRSTIGVRWTSTRNLDDGRRFLSIPGDPTSITGNLSSAPLKIDVIQLEVNSKF